MLERFHVPHDEEIRIQYSELERLSSSILIKSGLTEHHADIATDVLLKADIRGVDTHGVSNMLRNYVQYFNEGSANPKPNWKVTRETESCATVDSDQGLGVVVVPLCMEIAIEKAKKTGVGIVSIGNGRHLGMAAYHAMMALDHDMIGTCMTSSTTNVVPTHAAKPGIGTNPIAVAAPALNKAPFVFDAATSAIATNKVRVAQRIGVPLAPGWITDEKGNALAWSSSGHKGFKGSRKSTPYAAQVAAEEAVRRATEFGIHKLDIVISGTGAGRETAVRTLQNMGMDVGTIKDITPTPHNGCRPKKRRRG